MTSETDTESILRAAMERTSSRTRTMVALLREREVTDDVDRTE